MDFFIKQFLTKCSIKIGCTVMHGSVGNTWQIVCFAAEWASKCISTWGMVKTVMYRNCLTG